jgi:hypothetical protein
MKKKEAQEKKKKATEDCGTSNPSRISQEENMDEMSRLIKNLTKKISRFDIEHSNMKKSP